MKIRKLTALICLITIVACAFLLVGCVEQDEPDEETIKYEIKVVDGFGAPVENMVIRIYKGETEIDVKMTNKDGIVKCKDDAPLEAGDYTFKLEDPFGKTFYYDEDICKLSVSSQSVTVTISLGTEDLPSEMIYPQDAMTEGGILAPIIGEGAYRLTLNAGRNYFVLLPAQRGKYKVSVEGEGSFTYSYHGTPLYVQSQDVSGDTESDEIYKVEGGLVFSIRAYDVGNGGGTRYVFAVSSDADKIVNLKVSYDSELAYIDKELPWQSVQPSTTLTKLDLTELASGKVLKNLDVTDKNTTIVYNSTDKLYHLGSQDGPVVYMRLNTASAYALPALSTIAETQFFGIYKYEDGNLLAKRDYSTMLLAYSEVADDKYGVYPLTDDLIDFMKEIGSAWDWYNFGGDFSIFGENKLLVKADIAHLFLCCYFVEPGAGDLPPLGTAVGSTCPDATVSLLNGGTLDTSSLRGKVTVINFWGTWCPFCLDEMPYFDQLKENYGDEINVLAIHSSPAGGSTEPTEYVSENYPTSNITFAIDVASTSDPNTDVYYSMLGGTGSYPLTLVLDVDGVISFVKVGAATYDELAAAVESAK